VSGPIGLHGGGEFMPGDERFVAALLRAARPAPDAPIRVVVVPTAAAHGRPHATAALARDAIERVARDLGLAISVESAIVVDAASASDPAIGARLEGADLVYLPGGDPALVPGILGDTPAWQAILAAHERGTVVAGASAGAMGLALRTWTPRGWRDGLGLVRGLVVAPHFESFDRRGWEGTVEALRSDGFGYLGLDERTGVVSSRNGAKGTERGPWRVAGQGRAQWFPPDGEPSSATDGGTLDLPA
jgi:cyanophycinase-like exopeptidase